MTKDEMKHEALRLGIDLVGVTRTDRITTPAPLLEEPSRSILPTLIVLAKKVHNGAMGALDPTYRQFAAGRVMTRLEEVSATLGYTLEGAGYFATMVPSLVLDFSRQNAGENTPAGQGSRFLREAAVAAGLGTLGLNTMLLTPKYGPRVYLGAVMTDAEYEPDEPLENDLCLGLEECGRCAAICPEDAIPRQGPEGAPVNALRGLDAMACARSSQPFGVEKFVQQFQKMFSAESHDDMIAVITSPTTHEIWQDLTINRHATYSGCLACWQVCPVGDDYEIYSQSPHRQHDLPNGVPLIRRNGIVEIDPSETRAPRRPGVED